MTKSKKVPGYGKLPEAALLEGEAANNPIERRKKKNPGTASLFNSSNCY